MLCKCWAGASQYFFLRDKKNCHKNLDGIGEKLLSNSGRGPLLYWKLDQSSAQCLAQSFYQSLVFELKYDIGQNHMFYLNPVQSSRSKLTTCLRKGRDLGVCQYWNSTATSDGSAQELENNVRRNSKSIATKVCCQIGCK